MTIATMIDKTTQVETVLIDKAEVDQLRTDLEEARNEVIGLNVHNVLLQTDLNCMTERCEVYDSNILCRIILWLDVRIKRLFDYLRRRFDAWVERKWGTDY